MLPFARQSLLDVGCVRACCQQRHQAPPRFGWTIFSQSVAYSGAGNLLDPAISATEPIKSEINTARVQRGNDTCPTGISSHPQSTDNRSECFVCRPRANWRQSGVELWARELDDWRRGGTLLIMRSSRRPARANRSAYSRSVRSRPGSTASMFTSTSDTGPAATSSVNRRSISLLTRTIHRYNWRSMRS